MAYDNSIPSYASILEFQEVYLRAIALIWSDEYEKEENKEKSTFREEFTTDPMKFLQEKFAYNCPWNINLEVTESETAKWVCDGEKAGHWEGLEQNLIKFGHPQKPDPKYANSESVALAAYNDSGPVYLFTCC